MELVQSRIVTDEVARLAGFYASLLGVPVALNDYYVEVQAGPASVGFSRRRFTEYRDDGRDPAAPAASAGTRSSSISSSTTSTRSTGGSPRLASSGSCRPPPSPGGTGR